MTRHRRFKHVTLLVMLLAIACYCTAASDVVLAILALPGATIAWWARTRSWAAHIPRVLLNAALIASILYVLWLTMRGGIVLERIAELMVALSIIKCFDRSSARDYMELYTLAVFLAIAAVMTSVWLEVGFLLLVFLPTVVVGVMLLQIYTAHERVGSAARVNAPRSGYSPAPKIVAGDAAPSHFRRAAAAMVIGGFMVALSVFILVPRGIGENFLNTAAGSPRGMQTAFTGSVELGRAGLLTESQKPILHLTVTDDKNQSLGGPSSVYYLRGNVLDSYNRQAKSWTRLEAPTNRSRWKNVPAEPNSWQSISPSPGQRIRQVITLLGGSDDRTHLFSIYCPTRIKFDRRVRLEFSDDALMAAIRHTGELRYEVESSIQPAIRNRSGRRPSVSFNSDVVSNLTQTLLADADIPLDPRQRERMDDRAAVLAIRDFLHSQFTYTTDIQAPGDGQDPIDWFLSEHREGHCEYFASAMTAMCRNIGIEARVVAGYVAVEWNETGRHYVVRESNAHAWVEVREVGGVYRTYDPTPPDDLRAIHEPERGLLARLRGLLDAMEHLWVSRVVTFDSGTRETLIRNGAGVETSLSDTARQLFGKTRLGGSSLAIQAAMVGALVFLIVIGAGLVIRIIATRLTRSRRARRQVPDSESKPDESWLDRTEFYSRLLDLLSRQGIPKPPSRPPLAHLETVGDTNAEFERAATPLVVLYYRARFGRRPVGVEEQARAEQVVSSLDQATSGGSTTG